MHPTLAFDLGGSSLRLALVGEDGTFLHFVRRPLSFDRPEPGISEADPELWWHAFCEACRSLEDDGADLAQVGAIAGCGFTRTQVFLDKDGQSLRPAIGFEDSRASQVLADLRDTTGENGPGATLNPYDPPARLLWLKRHEPENWLRLFKVVEPKDFLNGRLTGIFCSDRISQEPMRRGLEGAATHLFDDAKPPSDREIPPPQLGPFDKVGVVLDGLPPPLSKLRGVPVFCGSHDTWSCVLGSGGLTSGVGYAISGTTDVSGVISGSPHKSDGLISIEWGPDLWQLGGPSQGAATRLIWAAGCFRPGADVHDAVSHALTHRRPAPLFLPFINGERTPFWKPELRGAFLGLSSAHDGEDFLRGVAEGINYLSRYVLNLAEAATGSQVRYVCFSGGLSGNPQFCQLKADILGRTVLVPDNPETGLMGAAWLPRGYDPEIAATLPTTSYRPDAARADYHDLRFSEFREAVKGLCQGKRGKAGRAPWSCPFRTGAFSRPVS